MVNTIPETVATCFVKRLMKHKAKEWQLLHQGRQESQLIQTSHSVEHEILACRALYIEARVRLGPLKLLALITFSTTLLALLDGYKLLKIPADAILEFVSGLQTQPGSLAFACNLTKSENTSIAYAGIYPAAMILKIILAQLLA